FDLQHRTGRYRSTVDDGAIRDEAKPFASLVSVVDSDPRVHLVGPGWQAHRPVVGNRGRNRAVYGARVVMITVGRRAIATYIDPRVPRAHDHITFQCGLAGDVDRGAVDR